MAAADAEWVKALPLLLVARPELAEHAETSTNIDTPINAGSTLTLWTIRLDDYVLVTLGPTALRVEVTRAQRGR